ncbi:hypothetical protein [Crocinitomix catalasitica]|uniref:hypothetical protein n=1 Tax=Crocinitomix catalasitica TaxID=184607 RepID=UPI0012FB4608|nr:hypothetical protein [Crocinitomix catalasitica]
MKNLKLILLLIIGFPSGASSHYLPNEMDAKDNYEFNFVMTRKENEVDYKSEKKDVGNLELKFKQSNNMVSTEVIF